MSSCGNIEGRDITFRRLSGVFGLAAALLMAWQFHLNDFPDWVRLTVFIPFFFGYLGLLQAHEKT